MAIDRSYQRKGTVTFVCDGCDRRLVVGVNQGWPNAMDLVRRKHWKMCKEDGKWSHYCCSGCAMLGSLFGSVHSVAV
jgi:hypothetical protein